jgi:SAM-dependent methyltransferase
MKTILDACCGSKMFWFQKHHKNTVYVDNRKLTTYLCDGRHLSIQPDILADFQELPFDNETFYHVVFDPPHLKQAGQNSWLSQKYGVLPRNWPDMIKNGFNECWRVLKVNGTLVFKWNEEQIPLKEILKLAPDEPLYGNKRSKTHWIVFFKSEAMQ